MSDAMRVCLLSESRLRQANLSRGRAMRRLGLRVSFFIICVAMVLGCGAAAMAQQVAVSPGFATAYVGTGKPLTKSLATYTGPVSGYNPGNIGASATDAMGNFYFDDGVIHVIASGKGPVPVLSNPSQPNYVTSPQAGTVYQVAGNGSQPAAVSSDCTTSSNSLGDGCYAVYALVSGGGGAAQMIVDEAGDILLSDTGNNEVRVIYGGGSVTNLPKNAEVGRIYAIAGTGVIAKPAVGDGGPALSASIAQPYALAQDASGNIYIADYADDALRVLYAGGSVPNLPANPVVGNLYTIAGTLNQPCNDSAPADPNECGDHGQSVNALLSSPEGVAVDASGNIYISDHTNDRLRVIYAGGTVPGLTDLVVGEIYTFAGNGQYSTTVPNGVPATESAISPGMIVIDKAGNLYVADSVSLTVRRIDTAGLITTVAGGAPLNNYGQAEVCAAATNTLGDNCPANMLSLAGFNTGVSLDAAGNLYIDDTDNRITHRIAVSASTVDLAASVGFSVSQPVYVYNTDTNALTINSVDLTADRQLYAGSGAQGGPLDCAAQMTLAAGATCVAQVVYAPLAVGNDAGNLTIASNATSGSTAIQLAGVAAQDTSSTTLAVSPALVNVGQTVTLTATVARQYGSSVAPTGTVTFTSGSTTLGSMTMGTDGTAALTVSNLAAGVYSIYATYSGDANYAGNSSYVQSLTVSATPVPVVTVASSVSLLAQGASVTLSATVVPYAGTVTPSGSVTFKNGGAALGTAMLDGSGKASLTTTALPPGMDTIFAAYGGDSTYVAALSNEVTVTVSTPARAMLVPGTISTVLSVPGSTGTVDSYGNAYFSSYNGGASVTASGKSPLPGVSGTPVAGTTYPLVGTTCPNYSFPCGVPGPASSAGINGVVDIHTDGSGNVYLLSQSYSIYKIDVKTDVITDVTPKPTPATGSAPASAPSPFTYVTSFFVDAAGNLYIPDEFNYMVVRGDAVTGVMTLVAGTPGTYCLSSSCGDGGPAVNALLAEPNSVWVDQQGNLFVMDYQAVRRVDGKTGIITTIAGMVDGTPCASYLSTNCGDGGPATAAYFNSPSSITGDASGNLYVADTYDNAVRKIDANGIITTIAGTIQSPQGFGGDGGPATLAQMSSPANVSLDGAGNLYVFDSNNDVIREVTAGTSGLSFPAASVGPQGMQVVQVANTSDTPLHVTGLTFPDGFVQQPSGGSNDCTGADTIAPGQACAIGIAYFPAASGSVSGGLYIADDSTNAVSGANVVSLSGVAPAGTQSNTISFAALSDVSYGSAPITLSATASSGNAVTLAATGPATLSGNVLTITGTGTVTVTAYQFGDSTYAPATPVAHSFNVKPVMLTVTANSFSCEAGQITTCLAANPLSYAISGFVSGDTQAVVSGTATLTTSVVASSPAGAYPITFATENLAAANYSFNYMPGTLTVAGDEAQTITFAPLPNVTYGTSPISLSATASSGLPVSYTVSGPATVAGNVVTVTGAGVVAVTAQQAGNTTFVAAPAVTQSFVVNKATLTVTANNQTMAQGNSPAPFTASYSGFVNEDTSAAVTGSPAFSSSAGPGSPLGATPIVVTQGTLVSSNYSFTFVNGTVNVVQGTAQTISFTPVPALEYGIGPVTLVASASSGLPVSYTVTGPARVVGSTLNVTGAGTIVVTASQAGSGIYTAAAPVSQTVVVAPAILTVTAANASRVNNVPNPVFTYALSGFVNGDTSAVVVGAPGETTTATQGSPVGTYPIHATPGSLVAANYTFATVDAVLTVTSGGPQPDFSITSSPQVLTMLPGQLRQATLTLTPINYFEGTVTVSCGSLPANMSCVFTPASFDVDGTGTPQTLTLTVNTNGSTPIVGALRTQKARTMLAGIFWLPAAFTGLLIAFNRKRLAKNVRLRQMMVLFLLLSGVMGMAACGGGTSSSGNSQFTAPGTSIVAVTAAGTSSNLTGTDSHTLNLTITVEGPQ